MYKRGFTLIELLVVIAIIGILSSIVLTSVNSARERAKIARAQADLKSLRNSIELLIFDTGKWPHGCIPNITSGNAEVDLSTGNSGIAAFPSGPFPVTTDAGATPDCEWTSADNVRWRGPYFPAVNDPWGQPYLFDPDYYTDGTYRRDCPSNNAHAVTDVPAIISRGANGQGGSGAGGYDCDDIVFMLNEGGFAEAQP